MKRLGFYFLVFTVVAIAGIGKSHAQRDTVVFAVGEWPPMIAEDAPDFGEHSRRVSAIFQGMGYEVKFAFLSWQRAYEQTRRGDYVATFSWVWAEDRPEKFLMPTHPIAQAYQKGFYKPARFPNGLELRQLDEIRLFGLHAVGVATYWHEATFEELGIDADIVANAESAWRFLNADRADIFVEEEQVGWADLENFLGSEVMEEYATTAPLRTDDMFILFSRNHPDGPRLHAAFDAFMATDAGRDICQQWAGCGEDEIVQIGPN